MAREGGPRDRTGAKEEEEGKCGRFRMEVRHGHGLDWDWRDGSWRVRLGMRWDEESAPQGADVAALVDGGDRRGYRYQGGVNCVFVDMTVAADSEMSPSPKTVTMSQWMLARTV